MPRPITQDFPTIYVEEVYMGDGSSCWDVYVSRDEKEVLLYEAKDKADAERALELLEQALDGQYQEI